MRLVWRSASSVHFLAFGRQHQPTSPPRVPPTARDCVLIQSSPGRIGSRMTALLELDASRPLRPLPQTCCPRDLSRVGRDRSVAVLGPNGAGKTTTLRAVYGHVGALVGHRCRRARAQSGRPRRASHSSASRTCLKKGAHVLALTVGRILRLGAYTRRGSSSSRARAGLLVLPMLSERASIRPGR